MNRNFTYKKTWFYVKREIIILPRAFAVFGAEDNNFLSSTFDIFLSSVFVVLMSATFGGFWWCWGASISSFWMDDVLWWWRSFIGMLISSFWIKDVLRRCWSVFGASILSFWINDVLWWCRLCWWTSMSSFLTNDGLENFGSEWTCFVLCSVPWSKNS